MKLRVVLSVVLAVFTVHALGGEAEVDSENPAGQIEGEEDSLILKVLGEKIYLKDINPSQAQMEKQRKDKSQEQFDIWLRQNRKSILSSYFRVLFDRYAQEQGFEVTDADVKQFNKSMQRTISSQIKQAEKKINSLEKELKADNLSDNKRSELNSRVDIYSKSIKRKSRAVGNFQNKNHASETMILQWKINSQLYKQYGGRVIFQQAGPEPLDAYRKFFEDQQGKGLFEFYDKEAEDLFWDYYRNEKIHTFYSDAAEAKNMMDTPWWLSEPKETLSREDVILWGQEINGFQVRIRPKKLAFRIDKTATIIVDLLNAGDGEFSCAPLEQFFEIEVDGRWYKWDGPEAMDILSMPISPKQIRYDFSEIKLTDQWLSREEESMKLNLSLGVHSIRVKYKTMSHPGVSTVEVVSNQMKFKILPQKPKTQRDQKAKHVPQTPSDKLEELIEQKDFDLKTIGTDKLVEAVSSLYKFHKYAKAVDAGKEALRRGLTDKQGAEVRFYMAKSYEALSDGPLARRMYQEVIELHPEYEHNIEIALRLGELHNSVIMHGTERDVETAIKWFKYAIDHYSNPDTFYWEILRAHMGLGSLLWDKKEYSQAKEHFEIIYYTDSKNMIPLPYQRFESENIQISHRKHQLKMLFVLKQATKKRIVALCIRPDTKESKKNLEALIEKFSNDPEMLELAEIELEKLEERAPK